MLTSKLRRFTLPSTSLLLSMLLAFTLDMGHNYHHHHSTSDSVSQRVNSPRFSGLMTRRAHSFKRNTNSSSQSSGSINNRGGLSPYHEIELQLNSRRSKIGSNLCSVDGFDSVLERRQRFTLRKKIELVVVDLGLRERKKLGYWTSSS